jgi:hypothetical protein
MKESITKFDLESAFKALDEIDIPTVGKVRANKPALTEIFSNKSKFDSLFEEYYDISSSTGLEDAKDAREAEIAQAKLARIEKIVDLEAESAEDLLTSYVGKLIVQCPQCMTLFYKNEEDVVASEDDPTTVNINEVCQHCGNESGYSLIGKVGEAEPEVEEPTMEETPEGDLDLDLGIEGEETTEEDSEEDFDLAGDLEELDLDIEEDEPVEEEEEKKEESFNATEGQPLNEELVDDKELDNKLEAHNEYIEYLRTAIAQEEEKLEKATNEQVKVAIQRNIDTFKADLEAALPEAVKNGSAVEEAPVEEPIEEPVEEAEVEEDSVEDIEVNESLTEALHEDTTMDVSDEEFEQLINSPEFEKPISDAAVRAMLAADKEVEAEKKEESLGSIFSDVEELKEAALESMISDSLVEMYGNVAGFRLKDCSCTDNKFMVEGVIHFTSGNTRNTTYTFNEAFIETNKITLQGLNEKLGMDKQFSITGYFEDKTFITESFKVLKK